MKIKRLAATVSATFDDALSKIENHEAVADCVIDDCRKAVGKIRVQKNRAQAEVNMLGAKLIEQKNDQQKWQERALRCAEGCADTDEAKALACLQKAEQLDGQIQLVKEQLSQHEGLVQELSASLSQAEHQLQTLTLKRSALAARGAASQSKRRVDKLQGNSSAQELFDRWEANVVSEELAETITVEAADALELEFVKAEEASRLKAKLEQLRGNAGS